VFDALFRDYLTLALDPAVAAATAGRRALGALAPARAS